MRAIAALLLPAFGLACIESTQLELPSPPEGARSVFLVRQCGAQLRASVHPVDAAPSALTERCTQALRYTLLYSKAALDDLRLEPGRLELEACPEQLEPCCVDQSLPTPEPGMLWTAEIATSAEAMEFEVPSVPPDELTRLRYRRPCRCPRLEHRIVVAPEGYIRLSAAGDRDGRVIIAGLRVLNPGEDPEISESDLFETSVSELWQQRFPTATTTTTARREVVGLSITPTGDVYLGLAHAPELWVMSRNGALSHIAHPEPDRETRMLAQRPAVLGDAELAVAGEDRSSEVYFWSGATWRPFERPALMRGVCATPPDASEQQGALLWTQEDEVIFMPRSLGKIRRTTPTPQNAPDGFFRIRGEDAEWVRVGQEAGDCLNAVTSTPELGLVVGTNGRRLYLEAKDGWRPFEPSPRAGAPPRPSQTDVLIPVPGGFAYAGTFGVFGLVHEGVLCEERVLSPSPIFGLTWAGDTLIASGGRTLLGTSVLSLIRFVDP